MTHPLSILRQSALVRLSAILLLSFIVAARPVMAQSILRDAETEIFFAEISAPLAKAAWLEPKNLEVVLVHDPAINAFVAGGQRIYIHTGLIEAADSANEVQGVIAHELGHIEGGHVIRFADGAKPASNISILGMLAGVGMMLAGAGDVGMAAMMGSQQIAMASLLAYSRGQENTADASGARYLSEAGISGKGSLAFFRKLQSYEFRLGRQTSQTYATTHPLTGDRIRHLADVYQADPAWETPLNQPWEADFKLMKANLMGYVQSPAKTLAQYPASDESLAAHYARAYALQQQNESARALEEARYLVTTEPNNPFFHEIEGQLLLETGHPQEALAPLRRATQLSNNHPLIASMFGHALVATDEEANYAEAEQVLRTAVAIDRENPDAWLQLGTIYHARGDKPRAALAGAERHLLLGEPTLARNEAEEAMRGLPEYGSDWIRAQDLKLIAEAQIEKKDEER